MIITIEKEKDEKFLRKKTSPVDLKNLNRKEIRDLIKKMREAMKKANGVGLSANQIGLPLRLFVAQVADGQGKPKFYAVLNPEIVKISAEKDTMEEGCLSVPETFGPVERSHRVTLNGFDPNGKKLKIKAWGLLARVFQHEVDHLNGSLFVDRTKKLYKVTPEPAWPGKK